MKPLSWYSSRTIALKLAEKYPQPVDILTLHDEKLVEMVKSIPEFANLPDIDEFDKNERKWILFSICASLARVQRKEEVYDYNENFMYQHDD